MLAGRVSSRTTCGCRSCSSAESSIVTIRSVGGMNDERMLSSVVLPAPVPPEISTLSRDWTMALSMSTIGWVTLSVRSRSSALSASRLNLRIERWGPSIASGLMIAFTREPSGRRASTMGEESSIRRPTAQTIRSMTWSRCRSSWKRTSVRSSRPFRSMKTCLKVLTRMSEMAGSWISGSSGPRPKISSSTWLTSSSRSSKLSGTASWVSRSYTTRRMASTTWSRVSLSRLDRLSRSISLRWTRAFTVWKSGCTARARSAVGLDRRRHAAPFSAAAAAGGGAGGRSIASQGSLGDEGRETRIAHDSFPSDLRRPRPSSRENTPPLPLVGGAVAQAGDLRPERAQVARVLGVAVQHRGLAAVDRADHRVVVVADGPEGLERERALHVLQGDVAGCCDTG